MAATAPNAQQAKERAPVQQDTAHQGDSAEDTMMKDASEDDPEANDPEQLCCRKYCRGKVEPGRKQCARHLAMGKAYRQKTYLPRLREHRAVRKQAGQCFKCGEWLDRKGSTCERCHMARRARIDKLRACGKCECGRPLVTSRASCERCLANQREAARYRRTRKAKKWQDANKSVQSDTELDTESHPDSNLAPNTERHPESDTEQDAESDEDFDNAKPRARRASARAQDREAVVPHIQGFTAINWENTASARAGARYPKRGETCQRETHFSRGTNNSIPPSSNARLEALAFAACEMLDSLPRQQSHLRGAQETEPIDVDEGPHQESRLAGIMAERESNSSPQHQSYRFVTSEGPQPRAQARSFWNVI
ncbi:hypothetical protein GGR57DRAFT_326494 [Xylariaceae sp. FL1272]|nr:hypothetical protein GGR57DRAFT_326494 [Xylariaceae sp. FL1272]